MHRQLLESRSGTTKDEIATPSVSPCYFLATTGTHILRYRVHVEDERMRIVPRTCGRRLTLLGAHLHGRRMLAKHRRTQLSKRGSPDAAVTA
jgi:hypothetical protein